MTTGTIPQVFDFANFILLSLKRYLGMQYLVVGGKQTAEYNRWRPFYPFIKFVNFVHIICKVIVLKRIFRLVMMFRGVKSIISLKKTKTVDCMLTFTDFIELVWKRCQLYVRMRSQPYSLACQALKNLISHASAYQFTTERLKTMCLFFKVRRIAQIGFCIIGYSCSHF